MDNFRSTAIVFSRGQAVGWIYEPMSGFARFVPFSGRPSFDNADMDPWFDGVAILLWFFRPWLIVGQVIFLLLWLLAPRPPSAGVCASCGYDLRATPERCPECGTIAKKTTDKIGLAL
jgi:hypothetical protein